MFHQREPPTTDNQKIITITISFFIHVLPQQMSPFRSENKPNSANHSERKNGIIPPPGGKNHPAVSGRMLKT
jgi:hypothetical protein